MMTLLSVLSRISKCILLSKFECYINYYEYSCYDSVYMKCTCVYMYSCDVLSNVLLIFVTTQVHLLVHLMYMYTFMEFIK